MRLGIGILSFVGVVAVGVGCGGFGNTSLGVPHEDPEPIGSAPWEQEERARDADETKPSTPEELRARSAARKKRRARDAGPATSASATPPAPPAPTESPASSALPSPRPSADAAPVERSADAPLFENLDLVFGDAPRALDARERDGLRTLAESLKTEPLVTLAAHAKRKEHAEGWLAIHKKLLVDAGVRADKIVTEVCIENAGLTHTVIARGKVDCDGH